VYRRRLEVGIRYLYAAAWRPAAGLVALHKRGREELNLRTWIGIVLLLIGRDRWTIGCGCGCRCMSMSIPEVPSFQKASRAPPKVHPAPARSVLGPGTCERRALSLAPASLACEGAQNLGGPWSCAKSIAFLTQQSCGPCL
jgi:hypothetical protein